MMISRILLTTALAAVTSTGAMAQGAHRYERGESFYREARNRAAESGVAFGWRLRAVPGAAHENRKMSAAAATVLMEP